MNPTFPVIQASALRKVYRSRFSRREVVALDRLDLELGWGEVLGLLGPNGAGKTTSMHLLLGFLKPTSGTIRLFGGEPSERAVRARIGFLPEESPFPSRFTAEETLRFYGRLFRIPSGELRLQVDELLHRVGLDRVRHRRVGEFSKGMKRRLGIAQALLNDPDLVVLDEPTAGLDPLGTREVKEIVRSVRSRGASVILSSHLLSDLEAVCDRVVMLHGGRVVREGRLAELLARPDECRLAFRGLNPHGVRALIDEALRRECEVVSMGPGQESLEEFFLRALGNSDEANR
ncbi:MAG: ABC transporter ATP-binding protein [Planctomycetes bacterium]|nr:ABC transporter ATP-binding protein [Planctomycetota bacterium]MBI3844241.1 ABC transporter ATP-binding protein [Planctomycetota bacterium]